MWGGVKYLLTWGQRCRRSAITVISVEIPIESALMSHLITEIKIIIIQKF